MLVSRLRGGEEHPDAIDAETAGTLAAIGIAHGRAFEPDQRMTRILAEEEAPAEGAPDDGAPAEEAAAEVEPA